MHEHNESVTRSCLLSQRHLIYMFGDNQVLLCSKDLSTPKDEDTTLSSKRRNRIETGEQLFAQRQIVAHCFLRNTLQLITSLHAS
jgi:hypothetical protein